MVYGTMNGYSQPSGHTERHGSRATTMALATYFFDYFTLQSRRLVNEKGGQCTITSLLPTQLLSLRITSLSFRL